MQDFLREIIRGEPIPDGKLAYFGASLCNLFHQAMLSRFGEAEKNGLTKRELARRIGKKPEQITRWLSYPGNLTLDTIAAIFVGMGIEVEKLELLNLIGGGRCKFPQDEEAVAPEEMRTPIELDEQASIVVPLRPLGRTPTNMGPRTPAAPSQNPYPFTMVNAG